MKPVIIVGSGLAGYGVAKEFRKLDTTTPLLIITADDGGSYSKPMLSNALSKGKTAEQLVMADNSAMAKTLNAEIHNHTRVTAINSAAHEIQIGDTPVGYSKLVLALGATPTRLPLQGDGADAVLSINNLQDYRRFRLAITDKKRIAILGGGLIGCEFANDLANSGYQVEIIDRNPHPLGKLLPTVISSQLQQKLEEIGVNWHGNDSVKEVNHRNNGYQIRLESGSTIVADLILSAIGLQPNTALAQAAALTISRGIVVDQYLQTSADDIYALGDCAEVEGHLLPFVMPLMHAARALGATLAGQKRKVIYPAMAVSVKTPAYPVALLPPSQTAGEWQTGNDGVNLRAIYRGEDGSIKGFALGGRFTNEASKLATQIPALLE